MEIFRSAAENEVSTKYSGVVLVASLETEGTNKTETLDGCRSRWSKEIHVVN